MKKLVVGVTAPGSVILIAGQMKWFASQGYKTYLMCPSDARVDEYCKNEGCEHVPVEIGRDISLIKDLQSLWTIFNALRKIKPDVVNVGTPKMGLLGMVASMLLGVKRRIYTCRGFRFEHEHGLKRLVLVTMERIAGLCAQRVICISPSLKELADRDKIFSSKKSVVIHKGSSNGFDLKRFSRENVDETVKVKLKLDLNLLDQFVFGFVGRINQDKGVLELYEAFDRIYATNKRARLLLVGRIEEVQIYDRTLKSKLQQHPGILMVGPQMDVPLYMSLMDVVILPSWREGFGNVLVQAAAMGIPVIASDATGTRSAVSPGYNGILVRLKNSEDLERGMRELMEDTPKRKQFGANGIEWAHHFSNEIVWQGMNELYKKK